MKRLLNAVLSFLKYLLLVLAFGSTLFVILKLYTRLEKDITESISVFLPYLVLLIMFVISFCLNREYVRKNMFFNVTCCLVFLTNLVVVYRAIFDTNMLFNGIQKMGVNFNYFNDYLAFNNIMIYGLAVSNLVFIFMPNDSNVKKVRIPTIKKNKKDKKTLEEVKIVNEEEKKDNRNIVHIINEEENKDKDEKAEEKEKDTDEKVEEKEKDTDEKVEEKRDEEVI